MFWIIFLIGCLGCLGLTGILWLRRLCLVSSLRDVSERYCVTTASRESVRKRFHKFSRLFSVDRRFRGSVAVDETG
jgi:hypothetical protein